jgi:hypothetical protein
VNIFILDENPKTAAQYHCDKHVVKMILEHTQMLSTAIRVHSNNTIENVYKIAHLNHPCSIWTRQNRQNFLWLCEMTEELFQEYSKRYNKTHKSYSIFQTCKEYSHILPEGNLTQFAQAMPQEYKNSNPITAYRTYYIKDKKDFAKWKNGNTPEWFLV